MINNCFNSSIRRELNQHITTTIVHLADGAKNEDYSNK